MAKKRKKEKTEEAIPQERTGKQKRLVDNLMKTTQQFLEGKSYVPLTSSELMERLRLPEQHHEMFKEVLQTLEKQRLVTHNAGRYSPTGNSNQLVRGPLKLHPRGFGFVKAESPSSYSEDIFIPKHLTNHAVDGDNVEVLVNEVVSEKGPEGRIVAILERSRTHMAGIINGLGRNNTYYAYAPMLGPSQQIVVESHDEKLSVGDRIVMKILVWGSKDSTAEAVLSHKIGHISDASCDITAAIEEFELRSDFATQAVQEAKDIGTRVEIKEIAKREDLRAMTCFTIDPDTAKDFDDAISLTKDNRGHYHLGVHIADVSHYVRPGSALDEEAKTRANSTYFPGYCLPMLPKELSDNLCSLKANVNRLTASVLMEFDSSGELVNYRITRSVIKSAKRFTYKEAKAVLDGKKKSIHLPTLQLMVELCGLLKKQRYERGSVEFCMPELVVMVDDKGVPTGTDYIVYDITHQLVEEFMLKANETVATHLSNEGKNLTYRIHDVPAEDNMKDFASLAAAFGFHLSETPTVREIQQMFDEAMSTPYGEYLATSYIRRMRLAAYSADNIGHYGLSLTHYCHFTSPIRRYVDLVVHRILFHEPEEKSTLDQIAQHCSERERISAKAENSVVLLKKLRLLQQMTSKEKFREFEAVVTSVKNFGIYFEVLELMLEGYLHVSEIGDDYYVFEEEKRTLRGRHTGASFHAGNKLLVMLKDVDLITAEAKWHFVDLDKDEESTNEFSEKKRKKGSKKFSKPHRRPSKTSKKNKRRR